MILLKHLYELFLKNTLNQIWKNLSRNPLISLAAAAVAPLQTLDRVLDIEVVHFYAQGVCSWHYVYGGPQWCRSSCSLSQSPAVSPSLSVPGECLSGHSGTLYGPPCHSGPSLPLSTVILLRLPQFVRPLLRPLSLLAIIRPALHWLYAANGAWWLCRAHQPFPRIL